MAALERDAAMHERVARRPYGSPSPLHTWPDKATKARLQQYAASNLRTESESAEAGAGYGVYGCTSMHCHSSVWGKQLDAVCVCGRRTDIKALIQLCDAKRVALRCRSNSKKSRCSGFPTVLDAVQCPCYQGIIRCVQKRDLSPHTRFPVYFQSFKSLFRRMSAILRVGAKDLQQAHSTAVLKDDGSDSCLLIDDMRYE